MPISPRNEIKGRGPAFMPCEGCFTPLTRSVNKGHRYLYEQRTWREGGHVRTQSRYVGRAGEGSTVRADRAAAYQTLTIPPDLQARSVASTAEPGEAVSSRSAPQTPLRDIYSQVTDRILADLEKGVRPWDRPWSVRAPTRPLRHDGEPYRGINIILLWLSAAEHGFSSPHWMTFRQAQELGGHVRKGEKGTWIAYASTIIRAVKDATGKPVLDDEGKEMTEDVHFLKGYTVFNVEQIEGLPDKYRQPATKALDPSERLTHADEFIAATGADIRYGGSKAYYTTDGDFIQMPPFEAFKEPEGYVATQVHELAHWTKHPTRLDRDLGRQRWGDEGYAMEELVAELGAAFICADLGIAPKTRDEHSSYIGSWLNVLKNDKRAIFAAAAYAQKAADYLHGERNVS